MARKALEEQIRRQHFSTSWSKCPSDKRRLDIEVTDFDMSDLTTSVLWTYTTNVPRKEFRIQNRECFDQLHGLYDRNTKETKAWRRQGNHHRRSTHLQEKALKIQTEEARSGVLQITWRGPDTRREKHEKALPCFHEWIATVTETHSKQTTNANEHVIARKIFRRSPAKTTHNIQFNMKVN